MTSPSSGTDASKTPHGVERSPSAPEKGTRRGHSRARQKPFYTQPVVIVTALSGLFFILILIAFVSGGIFESSPEQAARPAAPVADPELEAAKAMYNEAFRLMAGREYEGALSKVVAACVRFTELVDKHQHLVWVEDYFQRLCRWESQLREWEFARESEAFRKNRRTGPGE